MKTEDYGQEKIQECTECCGVTLERIIGPYFFENEQGDGKTAHTACF